ncbi:MAG TPA: hypothetical protein VK203_18890 [Nostocaceae cyanobacterium]|nr:hypothetical protein [Nostocaceae cyanobacterium]
MAVFGNIWVVVNSRAIFLEYVAIVCFDSRFMGDFDALVWSDRMCDWLIL